MTRITKKPKAPESEVAEHVIAYLEERGFDVYQEVEIEGVVADIVAVHGPEIWIVEVKTGWCLTLVDQLMTHKKWTHGHRIFAAVPTSKNWWDRIALMKALGFGVIGVKTAHGHTEVKTHLMAQRATSHMLPNIMSKLREEHKTWAKAGTKSAAGRWTPFKQTLNSLNAIVKQQPGIALKEALKAAKHHYASDQSAVTCVYKLAFKGVLTEITLLKDEKGVIRAYPKEAA